MTCTACDLGMPIGLWRGGKERGGEGRGGKERGGEGRRGMSLGMTSDITYYE